MQHLRRKLTRPAVQSVLAPNGRLKGEDDVMTDAKPRTCRNAGFVLMAAMLIFIVFWGDKPANAQTSPGNSSVFLKAFYPLDEPRFHCVEQTALRRELGFPIVSSQVIYQSDPATKLTGRG